MKVFSKYLLRSNGVGTFSDLILNLEDEAFPPVEVALCTKALFTFIT